MAHDLRPGEQAIDSWTLFYHPPGGGKYNGKLTVTNQRLLYDAKLEASLIGVLTNHVVAGQLAIEKDAIAGIEVQRKLFSKKATVTLTDGSRHIFDYGALNIDKCVAAMEAR
ncbi:hypothetical protein EEB18_014735 [Sphingopyxis sp. OPL5]|uniref:hypothetical protein n=1 Tax=Sphingopyxis sp. OPL5 TaxID=2486273 RepID=UPI0008CE9AD4|nr:hypothetical protein [Sphingopyxis sp. OPL5]OHC99853.1 MAG: hypothetical protein A2885_05115 [Sphingopyxis sp. RIFCSPHIGHO2_01_FULL_65_24]QNO26032.1 hypothetical protein EEB18_014735 [Sphingopyxis sp. OPL5]